MLCLGGVFFGGVFCCLLLSSETSQAYLDKEKDAAAQKVDYRSKLFPKKHKRKQIRKIPEGELNITSLRSLLPEGFSMVEDQVNGRWLAKETRTRWSCSRSWLLHTARQAGIEVLKGCWQRFIDIHGEVQQAPAGLGF